MEARGDSEATDRETSRPRPRWIGVFVLAGAGFFGFALFLSAVFDPAIRVLHLLQALIYVGVVVLTRRDSAWGFGAGFLISVFWNYTNLFVTSFISAGLQVLAHLVRTGHLERPDLLVAVVAALGHVLLIIACLAGFLRTRPRATQWVQFAAGGALAVVYLVGIILTTGPQYIPVLERIFRL